MKRRVLHVASKLDPGGVEKWLIELRKNSQRYEHFILCISGQRGYWDAMVEEGAVLYTPSRSGSELKFLTSFRSLANQFHIIHSHLYRFSAKLGAAVVGLPCKFIAHAHNDLRPKYVGYESLLNDAFRRWPAQIAFQMWADGTLAASKDAGDDLFGCGHFSVIHCGVHLVPPPQPLTSGVRPLRLVTVGSLSEQKNHVFLISVADELRRRGQNFTLEIIGEGKLRPQLQYAIDERSLSAHVRLSGISNEVPRILSEKDIFLFPSHHEGLGLVAVEAQAAGLPCVLSPNIPQEADVVSSLIHRVPLQVGFWVDTIVGMRLSDNNARVQSYQKVKGSDFNIAISTERLENYYDSLI